MGSFTSTSRRSVFLPGGEEYVGPRNSYGPHTEDGESGVLFREGVPIKKGKWINGAFQARHLALVIGIADYVHMKKLACPVKDAIAVAEKMKVLGFECSVIEDANLTEVTTFIFDEFLKTINAGDVVFIYFSGHAVGAGQPGEKRLSNYLLPKDFNPNGDVTLGAVSVSEIVDEFNNKHAALVMLVIDACAVSTSLPSPSQSDEFHENQTAKGARSSTINSSNLSADNALVSVNRMRTRIIATHQKPTIGPHQPSLGRQEDFEEVEHTVPKGFFEIAPPSTGLYLISFAAGPGAAAFESAKIENSHFTTCLLKNLQSVGADTKIKAIFEDTSDHLFEKFGHNQRPWLLSNLTSQKWKVFQSKPERYLFTWTLGLLMMIIGHVILQFLSNSFTLQSNNSNGVSNSLSGSTLLAGFGQTPPDESAIVPIHQLHLSATIHDLMWRTLTMESYGVVEFRLQRYDSFATYFVPGWSTNCELRLNHVFHVNSSLPWVFRFTIITRIFGDRREGILEIGQALVDEMRVAPMYQVKIPLTVRSASNNSDFTRVDVNARIHAFHLDGSATGLLPHLPAIRRVYLLVMVDGLTEDCFARLSVHNESPYESSNAIRIKPDAPLPDAPGPASVLYFLHDFEVDCERIAQSGGLRVSIQVVRPVKGDELSDETNFDYKTVMDMFTNHLPVTYSLLALSNKNPHPQAFHPASHRRRVRLEFSDRVISLPSTSHMFKSEDLTRMRLRTL